MNFCAMPFKHLNLLELELAEKEKLLGLEFYAHRVVCVLQVVGQLKCKMG